MNHETASYLCHHGVKGMKWGVRKDRVKLDRKTRNKLREEQWALRNQARKQTDKKYEVYKKLDDFNKFETKMRSKHGDDFSSKMNSQEKKLYDYKYNKSESAIHKSRVEAGRITTQKLKSKYGSRKIDYFNESEEKRIKRGDAFVGAMLYAGMGAMTIGGVHLLKKAIKK